MDELSDEGSVFEEGGFGGFEGRRSESRASERGEEALEERDGEEGRRGEEKNGEGFVLEPMESRSARAETESRGSAHQVMGLPITSEVTAAAALAPTIAARKDPPTPIAPAR